MRRLKSFYRNDPRMFCRVVIALLLLFGIACEEKSSLTNGEDEPDQEIVLSFLWADITQFKYIHPGFSADAESGAPWGFKHQGIDLIAAISGAVVLAPASGVVQQLETYHNPINDQWQVNMNVRYSNRFSYNFLFEPRGQSETEVMQQRRAIRVSQNDRVNQGDTLGTILNLSLGDLDTGDVTVHFDLWVDGENICPEPYFEPEALDGVLRLLYIMYPDGDLCYP